ncbi:NUDIX domain-containing protein [Thalassotalea sp. PS06]|uniref:NUDIX domain-containing protein n=1 Tax=Thalassotalea sp. PS06 TaxID=2594005 RepID=UPI001161E19C|nr:NUDIX domain-containing protein [Thalassotalea sp. PS06]QDP01169.1 NUDIX hydrolase [Thalassotalea sp. PS06]
MKLASITLAFLLLASGIGWYVMHGDECSSPGFIGAGTTVFKKDAEGNVSLLLAYERGRGWSTFGGGPKKLDLSESASGCETPQQTAVRESVEESRMLLDADSLLTQVQSAKSYTNPTPRGDYITFLVELQELPDLQRYYSADLPNDPGYYETSEITWVPLNDIIERGRFVQTPNEQPLWEVFYQQFDAMLQSQPTHYWFNQQ